MLLFAASVFILLTQVVGSEFVYVTQPGDSLKSVAARFGVDVRVIAEANELETTSRLKAGRSLRIDNRHIVPERPGRDIVINVPQRMLFYYREGSVFRYYPIAVGKPATQTPVAAFSVVMLERNPVWDVPLSIQQEMRSQGKRVVTRVPPSPANPLGKYWIALSLGGIGIHGTNAPTSIYSFRTHGCIRLHPRNIEDLFSLVEVGATGQITYETVLVARAGNSVFIEAHPDVYGLYGKNEVPVRRVFNIASASGFANMIDWALAAEVIRMRDGIARDVTRRFVPVSE